MIHEDRVRNLNDRDVQPGDYLIYWMQQSQRALDNHALEYAIEQSNRLKKKLIIVFGLTEDYPDANLRHYHFMLQGLAEVHQALAERGLKMVIGVGSPDRVVLSAAKQAAMIVCDRGYLRHQKQWRRHVAQNAPCQVVQVESDVIVPVEKASEKCEYAARFIRPKLNRLVEEYLDDPQPVVPEFSSLDVDIDSETVADPDRIIDTLKIDTSVRPVKGACQGGTRHAIQRFEDFLTNRLARYQANRNQPQTDDVSYMGMYLHFGQISPLYLVRKTRDIPGIPAENKEAYLEELIVRRELAVNYVHFNNRYDSFSGLPDWAKATLKEHASDPREFIYTRKMLENAKTHDPYWNAAAKDMMHTGYMHNYMRMYWVKKIIEWSKTPQTAYQTAIYLNNKFFIDGRDPSSYAGVAWGFGLHDRPWKERRIFGKVRYMNAAGLERKCDIKAYVKKVEQMCPPDGVTGRHGNRP